MTTGRTALVLAVTLVPFSSVPPPAARKVPFVPGELIVKFRSGSEGARLAASPAAARDVGATLSPVTDRLSREIGLPLTARRALSGGEVLLAIEPSSLTHRLLSAARRDRTLEDATLEKPADPGAARGFPTVHARLRHAGVDTGALATRISERLDLPVSIRAGTGKEVLVSLDGDALTLQVLERLEGRSDVEYVQPNYVVGKLGS
jgi:hypothetical protein